MRIGEFELDDGVFVVAEIGNNHEGSVAASWDLPEDHVLDWQDLTWLRPGTGTAPGGEDAIVGKRLSAPISHGETISPEQLR